MVQRFSIARQMGRSRQRRYCPLLASGACALDLEPARSTDDAARELAARDDAHDLTYTELAVALHASGVHPKHFRSAGPAQLWKWAAQGLALLGIDRIRSYEFRTRYIHCRAIRYLNGRYVYRIPADMQAEYARMWPDSAAQQSCHDAAWRLTFPRPASPDHSRPHAARSALHR